MKKYCKLTDTTNNEPIVLFNLDKLSGKLCYAMMIIGFITTTKAIIRRVKRG